ncbi:hypothetical protein FGO68_gene12791 [Halteria grandinella]|uniref:Uncharacterized protein n=1 Tax=Halteria grandinella TaxID=5974 RepID=A0A8J8NK24_HALGN|nr:hypothetical protein FGO68_gene12791 [Halteria grandinella]
MTKNWQRQPQDQDQRERIDRIIQRQAELSPTENKYQLKLWNYSELKPYYSVNDYYVFEYKHYYGDAFCSLTPEDYDRLEGYCTEKIQVFWSNLDKYENWDVYHFSLRFTLIKKYPNPQDGEHQRLYLYAHIQKEGIQLFLRPIDSESEAADLKRLESNARLQYDLKEFFLCYPIFSARSLITDIINCKELTGYRGDQNCITFCLWAIKTFTPLKKMGPKSELLSERILAKYQDMGIPGMVMKYIVWNGICIGASWAIGRRR